MFLHADTQLALVSSFHEANWRSFASFSYNFVVLVLKLMKHNIFCPWARCSQCVGANGWTFAAQRLLRVAYNVKAVYGKENDTKFVLIPSLFKTPHSPTFCSQAHNMRLISEFMPLVINSFYNFILFMLFQHRNTMYFKILNFTKVIELQTSF